jgi:hypothetical protein
MSGAPVAAWLSELDRGNDLGTAVKRPSEAGRADTVFGTQEKGKREASTDKRIMDAIFLNSIKR